MRQEPPVGGVIQAIDEQIVRKLVPEPERLAGAARPEQKKALLFRVVDFSGNHTSIFTIKMEVVHQFLQSAWPPV